MILLRSFFSELWGELQSLREAVGSVCACLSPPSPAPLLERVAGLREHVEHVVRQAAFFGSSLSFAQAVSHFRELRPVLAPIAEGIPLGSPTRRWRGLKTKSAPTP